MTKQLYELGENPPLGEIPEKMHAWLIRPERFGKPTEAFQKEVVDIPRRSPMTKCWSTSWPRASTTTTSGRRSASRST